MTTRWTPLVLVIALGSIGAGPAVTAQAPTQGQTQQESRTTEQLLQEVRALRAAIERMTVSGTRAQLLLGRLQMQEQRMVSLGRQLQESRTKLASVQRERQSHAARIELLSERVGRALTAEEQLQTEMGIKAAKQELKQLDQQLEVLQADDASIAQALAMEQSRWVDLNGRLEELEGLLAPQKP
jgi:chromosome segregation ATPase